MKKLNIFLFVLFFIFLFSTTFCAAETSPMEKLENQILKKSGLKAKYEISSLKDILGKIYCVVKPNLEGSVCIHIVGYNTVINNNGDMKLFLLRNACSDLISIKWISNRHGNGWFLEFKDQEQTASPLPTNVTPLTLPKN